MLNNYLILRIYFIAGFFRIIITIMTTITTVTMKTSMMMMIPTVTPAPEGEGVWVGGVVSAVPGVMAGGGTVGVICNLKVVIQSFILNGARCYTIKLAQWNKLVGCLITCQASNSISAYV